MRLPTALLTILLSIFPVHDAGVSNEWAHKLPEQDEQRYRELEAKRSKEIAKGGKLSPQEEAEFQALDKRKYPKGRGGLSDKSLPSGGESQQDLINELRAKGTKFDEDKIVGIARDKDGKIVFLEEGNSKAGLQHIMRHAEEFNAEGIADEEIADVVVDAVTRGKHVGMQGTRPVYAVMHEGKTVYIAVTVGSNGFIVGANPTSKP